MLKRSHRDPAALPRLLLSLLALALLWPGIQLSELDLGVLLRTDSQSEMGRFVAAFWPPAHDAEFLDLLLQATLQTLAIATAGMALALLLAIPASLLASRALSLSAVYRGGRPTPLAQLLRWPVRGLLIFLRSVPEIVWRCCSSVRSASVPPPGCWPSPSLTAACSARSMQKFTSPSTNAPCTRCCRRVVVGWRRSPTASCRTRRQS